ncbi:mitochondrial 37S ribosomal protein YmS18 [Schizosaccharomyces japonicus yFS275]|uniref:Ribosomal protein subunit S18 n=1 Tax=Schizosaccharomyces japonicus (strain yFS275 / FY16936) TaxID=402676 RepID=B6K155_SCHJY|nr:mitochondrial 37S ribosomal protein YmS18 [Schizosaccharomyces japonicus yFS275]EEB07676.1 ribosomal protein subunit S18 [Schizosaccharomyces japonicus yFS275]
MNLCPLLKSCVSISKIKIPVLINFRGYVTEGYSVEDILFNGLKNMKSKTHQTNSELREQLPYKLHVKCSNNNTHVTFCGTDNLIIHTASGGTVGYKKVKRGEYDAAYAACSEVLKNIKEMELKVSRLEVIFSGFGKGREAVQKCLLGKEGFWIRDKIVRVRDATPIKFGGNRARKARRL